jgi:uncharacterized protein (DUF1499 family)
MIPAWLSFFDAILAVALVLAGIFGAHFAFAPPFFGFQLFALGFVLGIIGFIVGVIGIFATRSPQRAAARPRAVVGTVLSIFVAFPVLVIILNSLKYPPINDITTDIDNPPEFEHATGLPANQGRDMKYDKPKYAERQSSGYGKLEPLKVASDPDATFAKVEAVAKQMPSWEVTAEYPRTRSLEGICTSGLFHFQDDFVIQVRPASDGAGSLIEMRSKSRDGLGDFGVNYKRIKSFLAKFAQNSPAGG